ncbi:hypothetical protein ACP3T3_11275 [Chryseobacterium sp. CBSDS_008]|uniref:hypothetical protein n=1 Tax=Chryseobacterium sp. CBSDS_008 TaxID=3415265 RepID=UPI003CE9C228
MKIQKKIFIRQEFFTTSSVVSYLYLCIIDYLGKGHKAGRQIVIYGHSRGGAAAVRIANKLGDMNIHVAEVTLYDPVGMYGGGDFVFTHANVMKVTNYYQRNPIDRFLFWADNPFVGSPVSAKFQWPVINNVDLTGKYFKSGKLMNHLNITTYAIQHP